MLRASRRELERAYRLHRDLAQSDKVRTTQSHHLLLVYSLECGLKAAVMRRRNIDDTSMLGEINFGHDLREFLKYLRAPATLRISDHQTRQNEPQTVQPKQLHEALRYGIDLQKIDTVLGELNAIMQWLKEELL